MKTKMKNIITGRILEETFRSSEKIQEADLEKVKMQYLYSSEDLYHFLNQDSFDQISFGEEQIKSVKKYLKEQEIYEVVFFNGNAISVEPPMFMTLKVIDTVPGVKGDTAQGGSKHATLETGLVLTVPLFISEEDIIKIDTRDNSYIERITS